MLLNMPAEDYQHGEKAIRLVRISESSSENLAAWRESDLPCPNI